MLLYKSIAFKQNFLQNISKNKLHIIISRLNVTKAEGLAVQPGQGYTAYHVLFEEHFAYTACTAVLY